MDAEAEAGEAVTGDSASSDLEAVVGDSASSALDEVLALVFLEEGENDNARSAQSVLNFGVEESEALASVDLEEETPQQLSKGMILVGAGSGVTDGEETRKH